MSTAFRGVFAEFWGLGGTHYIGQEVKKQVAIYYGLELD